MNKQTSQQHLVAECFTSSALFLPELRYDPATATADERRENRIFHTMFLTAFVFGRANYPPDLTTLVADYLNEVEGMAAGNAVKVNKVNACQDYTKECYRCIHVLRR